MELRTSVSVERNGSRQNDSLIGGDKKQGCHTLTCCQKCPTGKCSCKSRSDRCMYRRVDKEPCRTR